MLRVGCQCGRDGWDTPLAVAKETARSTRTHALIKRDIFQDVYEVRREQIFHHHNHATRRLGNIWGLREPYTQKAADLNYFHHRPDPTSSHPA